MRSAKSNMERSPARKRLPAKTPLFLALVAFMLTPQMVHAAITSVTKSTHGTWVQFTVKTDNAAIMTLKASTVQPNANGEWSDESHVADFEGTILPTKNWTPKLSGLQSNTTYYYVVKGHFKNGVKETKKGSFKTLKRRVNVSFAKIAMIDDSDGAFAGDCDCFFWFNAGNEKPKPYGSLSNQKSIESGTSVHPNVQFTINNTPSEIRLRVLGMDDDTDFGEFCPIGVGYPTYTGAANWKSSGTAQECLQWAGDQILVFLTPQDDDDEEFTKSFTISVNGPLKFKVHGTYKVTYDP